jgi:hypothetical protein
MATLTRFGRFDVPLLSEAHSNVEPTFAIGRLPVKIQDLFSRPDVRGRISVTLEAPRHAERFCMVNDDHLIHFAVTRFATYAALNVHGVVEIGVVRQLVDLLPAKGPIGIPRLTQFDEQRTLRLDVQMTIHARFSRRHIRMGRLINVRVTVQA